MDPIQFIAGLSTAINKVRDVLSTIKDAEQKLIFIDLIDQLVESKLQANILVDENRELRQQIEDFNNWETEVKSKYKLEEVSQGVLVYVYQPSEENTDPAHWLCPQCFEDRIKSILQRREAYETSRYTYFCNNCSGNYSVANNSYKSEWDNLPHFGSMT